MDPQPRERPDQGRRAPVLVLLLLIVLPVVALLAAHPAGRAGARPSPGTGVGPSTGSATGPRLARSGRDYRPDLSLLTAAAGTLLSVLPAPDTGSPAPALQRLHQPAALAGCLSALQGPPGPTAGAVLALDYARFLGQPALLVLTTDPDPTRVAAYLVSPACAAGDDGLLFYARLSRTGR